MTKKSLYDKNERYTLAAQNISNIARTQGIVPAFEWAQANGFSLREASHVIHGEVTETELTMILTTPPATSDGRDDPSEPL